MADVSEESDLGIERISSITDELTDQLSRAISQIERISSQTRVLSINAKIRAARAGKAGAAFSVVADEVAQLSKQINIVTEDMSERSLSAIEELSKISQHIAIEFRGTRLCDIALTNIDLIDRNLYERTCDVRWWATDDSLVKAVSDPSEASCQFASHRLGVILDSYTVYYDLVLCNLEGVVIANGRPNANPSEGSSHGSAEWFQTAMDTRSGEEYGFESVHKSPLVKNKLSLVYSCAVREGGDANGKALGVLGVVFDWPSLAQQICLNPPLSQVEKAKSRICIVDADGLVLADSQGEALVAHIHFDRREHLFAQAKSYVIGDIACQHSFIAHAQSPGFETYKTGFHSLITQPT